MKKKKEKIFNATIELLNTEGTSVSTAKIAKAAGVSNGTLFNYFPTKQVLIDTVYLSLKEEIASHTIEKVNTSGEVRDIFLNLWTNCVTWSTKNMEKHKTIILLKYSKHISTEAFEQGEKLFEFASNQIEKEIAENRIANMPIEYIRDLAIANTSIAINYAYENKLTGEKLKKHIETSFNIFWTGISQ